MFILCISYSVSVSQFEKQAETMEILLGDRNFQLESMPTSAPNLETNADLLRRVKVSS